MEIDSPESKDYEIVICDYIVFPPSWARLVDTPFSERETRHVSSKAAPHQHERGGRGSSRGSPRMRGPQRRRVMTTAAVLLVVALAAASLESHFERDEVLLAAVAWETLRSARYKLYYVEDERPTKENCSWTRIRAAGRDRGHLNFLGLPVHGFQALLRRFEPAYTAELNQSRTRRGRPRAMDPAAVLASAFHHVRKKIDADTLSMLFGTSGSVVKRELQIAIPVLRLVLRRWKRARILWPDAEKMAEYSHMVERRHGDRLRSVFGFADGLNVGIEDPADEGEQNLYYIDW